VVTAFRKLYDLAAADPALRFSPYCWRTKLALAHKGLTAETIPWRFTEKEKIAFSGQKLVPVLVDGETVVSDSQAIAEYLEATYPEAPSLFGDAQARALASFIKHWVEVTLGPALVKILMPDIFKIIHPKDQPYFRATREARLGMTIEALGAQRSEHVPVLTAVLAPLNQTLKDQTFLAGAAPLYADHIAFGSLQWANKTSSTPLWEPDGPIALWMQAVLDYYGGAIVDI
jgi:glutathione S-transferase